MVLQRAPWRRLEVAAGHRRLRGGPRRCRDVRRSRRRRRRHPLPQHHRGDQPPRLPPRPRSPTTSSSPRSSSTTPTSCPGRGRPAPLRRVRHRRHLQRGRRRPTSSTGLRGPGCWRSPAPRTSPGGCRPSTTSSPPRTTAGVPVLVDAAQLAPHRPLPVNADFVAWSGHKMYAPFGAGVLIGPRATFATATRSSPAAVPSTWSTSTRSSGPTRPTARRRARPTSSAPSPSTPPSTSSPRSAGTRSSTTTTDRRAACTRARPASRGSASSAPAGSGGLPVATFVVEGQSHALVAARLSAEHGIGVRHGCFCAHPYLLRLLDLDPSRSRSTSDAVRRGDRRHIPGAVRASAGLSTTADDVDRFLEALGRHHRRRRTAGGLRPGPPHRRLLAPHRRPRLVERRAGDSAPPAPAG